MMFLDSSIHFYSFLFISGVLPFLAHIEYQRCAGSVDQRRFWSSDFQSAQINAAQNRLGYTLLLVMLPPFAG